VFVDPVAFAARVEVSGRPPAAFAPHPGADFKLPPAPDRARVRDAVKDVVGARASRVAAGQPVPPPQRAELEALVAQRLGVAADVLRAAEVVQALLDVCRDWADEHARLAAEGEALDQLITDLRSAGRDPEQRDPDRDPVRDPRRDPVRGDPELDPDQQEELALAEGRRAAVRVECGRHEAGLAAGCQLLGAYGAAARPAADWLAAQAGGPQPWRGAAALALAGATGGK
jgi:hypothetical protein